MHILSLGWYRSCRNITCFQLSFCHLLSKYFDTTNILGVAFILCARKESLVFHSLSRSFVHSKTKLPHYYATLMLSPTRISFKYPPCFFISLRREKRFPGNEIVYHSDYVTISYPVSSGFLVSGATPGRLWGHRKNSIFLIGCSVTVAIVLPQKSCGNKIRCPQSLPGVAPLTKKPEDSGYEIDYVILVRIDPKV